MIEICGWRRAGALVSAPGGGITNFAGLPR